MVALRFFALLMSSRRATDVPAVSAAILLRPTQSKRSTSSKSDESSVLNLEKSQLFWITLAALSNMALLMTFALGH